MAFDPPDGILDIGNATLRVGKLEVAETSGLNQGLQNIIKNDLLITENNESSPYTTNQKWGLKLPTTWVAEFEVKGHSGKYIDFNFYNENSASNALGYNLTFMDTTMTLRYDGGSALGGGAATIPTIVGAYRKVNIFFERGVISVSIDGTRYLYHKETDGFNQDLGVASRVVSATGSAFVNLFIEQNAANSAFKNLRIVNGRFISDKTSNIAFIGGNLGVGVNSPKEALDIRGNMHLTRVSNVSQISVDSNVVTEYTGPHDRPLRKYPEVELDVNAMTSPGVGGYIVAHSGQYPGFAGWTAFGEEFTTTNAENSSGAWIDSNPGSYAKETADAHNGVVGSITTAVQTAGTLKLASNTPVGAWISLELPTSIKLQRIEMRARLQHLSETNLNEVALQSFPREFGIWGYDGSNWVLLKSVTGHSANSAFGYTPTHINATTAYNKYAIVVTRTNAVGGSNSDDRNFTAIGQLYFYGHEEGSGSLDTTLKTVYNVPATTGTQLEVYYDAKDLADGAVTSVTDLSPNTNNGTVSGDPQVSNGAFVFDGVGDSIGGSVTNGTGELNFTISMWVKPNTLVGSPFYFGPNTVGKAFGTNITTSIFYLFINGGTAQLYNTSDLMNTGEWSHLTFYRNNGEMSIYRNGIYIYPISTGSGALSLDANTVFTVGSRAATGTFFDGSIANFRIYNKVLNAGQVQELYDYQKDYFLGSKSQLTIYKGHLGVGVTEPSGQLELAGDERIQEYPPRALTGYETLVEGHGVFCASASSYFGTYYPWEAFDKNVTDTGSEQAVWHTSADFTSATPGIYNAGASLGGYTGAWLKLKLPYSIKPSKVSIHPRTYSAGAPVADYDQNPKDFLILGSKDDNTWDVLSTQAGVVFGTTWKDFILSPGNNSYSYFAISCTKVKHGSYFAIADMKYFGTPGPTTLDKGSLTLGRSLDVPRVSRYDVDTETPRPEKLVVDFDTTVNSSPTDISGKGNHGTFNGASYSPADKAFSFDGTNDFIDIGAVTGVGTGAWVHSKSFWFKIRSSTDPGILFLVGRSNSSTRQIAVQVNGSGQFQYFIYGCNSRVQVNGSDWYPDVNRWYHCVTVFKNNETTATGGVITGREMYIDGVKQTLVAINTQVSLNLNTTGVRFGNQYNSVYLNYQLSNPKLYSVALEPSEVKKLYNLGRTGRSMVISDTAVGIGKVPEAQLDVRGNMNVDGVITTPQRPVFYAYYSGAAAAANGYTGMIGFPNTRINVGNCFNTSDYKFYAPITGYYWFEFQLLAREGTGTGHMTTSLFKNGTNVSSRAFAYTMMIGSSDHDNLCFSVPVQMNAGDNIYPGIVACDTTVNAYFGEELAHFSGYFIG